jgi:hypothetical protein
VLCFVTAAVLMALIFQAVSHYRDRRRERKRMAAWKSSTAYCYATPEVR